MSHSEIPMAFTTHCDPFPYCLSDIYYYLFSSHSSPSTGLLVFSASQAKCSFPGFCTWCCYFSLNIDELFQVNGLLPHILCTKVTLLEGPLLTALKTSLPHHASSPPLTYFSPLHLPIWHIFICSCSVFLLQQSMSSLEAGSLICSLLFTQYLEVPGI